MAVVAARVHALRNLGRVVEAGLFFDFERVHVRAQGDGLVAGALDPCDDSRAFGIPALVLDAIFREKLGDAVGSPDFLEANLRMRVKFVAQGYDFG